MKKIKDWLKKTGLSNVLYLGGGIAAKFLLTGSLSYMLFGAGVGIFLYVNFNVIRKLIFNKKE